MLTNSALMLRWFRPQSGLLLFCFMLMFGAVQPLAAQNKSLEHQENDLANLLNGMVKSKKPEDRMAINHKFTQALKLALETEGAIDYDFEKLTKIGNLHDRKKNLRVFSWGLLQTDGTFKHYGFMLRYNRDDDKIRLYELHDQSDDIVDPQTQELSADRWLGCLYYELVEERTKERDYYVLLGWDGNTDFTEKKVIEICYFDEQGDLHFGAPVFQVEAGTANRLVFEYAERATMLLRFNEKLDMVVFDKLSPASPEYDGMYQFYGPDGECDGYLFKDGQWLLQTKVDARNPKYNPKRSKKE